MKKIICILFILLIFGTLLFQLAAASNVPLAKENSSISSPAGVMIFVERSSAFFASGVGFRAVFFYILYLAIFAITIRFTYKQRYFIKRLSLQQIRAYHKTTDERESDA